MGVRVSGYETLASAASPNQVGIEGRWRGQVDGDCFSHFLSRPSPHRWSRGLDLGEHMAPGRSGWS